MIGSHCLGCGEEIKEHERFRIVEGGVVHTTCTSRSGDAAYSSDTADHVLRSKKEATNGQ